MVFVVTFSTSCVEEYWPEVDRYQNVLVVDGMLTNKDSVVVNLSYSSSINDSRLIPISGALVYIVENSENTIYLNEIMAGTYQSDNDFFKGSIGSSYKLFVELGNGSKYQSDECFLQQSAPIDSVYGISEPHNLTTRDIPQQGIQFYLDNHNDLLDTCYYMWRLNKTYNYQSTFNIDYTWEGAFIPFPKPDSLRTCWHSSQVQEIFTYSTRNIDEPIIKAFPLNYSSTDNKELSIRYSLLVSQLSISKEAFDFWDAMRSQNINQGNLYSKQPMQIRGNVRNIANDEEPVLGFFTVGGVTKKRIYVNRPSLPFYYMICEPDYKSMGRIKYEPPEFWPIFLTESVDGAIGMATLDVCFDCRLEAGGSLTPPDFWEY